jgi:hypothetical protein
MKMARNSRLVAYAAAALVVLLAQSSSASASTPRFKVNSILPDSAQPGDTVVTRIAVENVGTVAGQGPMTIAETVAPGMSAPVISNVHFDNFVSSDDKINSPTCDAAGLTIVCTVDEQLPPRAQLVTNYESQLQAGATGTLANTITVSGDGAATVEVHRDIVVGAPQPFEIKDFATALLDAEGDPIAQAGADPAQFDTTMRFNSFASSFLGFAPVTSPVGAIKDVTAHLPVGLIGNPTAYPTCSAEQLAASSVNHPKTPNCPAESQVGVVHLALAGFLTPVLPLYNMQPPVGAASQLGFVVAKTQVLLDAYVRPGDHGLDVVSRNTSTTLPVDGFTVTAWGDPGSPAHDGQRGTCLESSLLGVEGGSGRACQTFAAEKAFLRLPTSCPAEGMAFGVDSNTYQQLDNFATASFTGSTLTGCELVPFNPTIYVQPTQTAANSPTGVAVQLRLPQNSNPEGLGESDLKKAVVTLPEGMALNPSAADGLQACDDAHLNLESQTPSECSDGSKVGTVLLHTPLLESPIEGFIWLRTQNSSDPASGEMFRLAIELRDDRHGIDIKLPGHVAADPKTGRLTSTFDNAPQLPFGDMTLHFKSGARAPLTTPFSCVPQTTEADLYPWARPQSPVHTGMTFQLTSGPEGLPCQAARPFSPGFSAGVSSVQAGGYTPFLTTFSRKDSDQSMQRVSVKMPKGLLGSLIGLPLCPEAQANAGACDQESQIGTVTAGAGDGPTPFYVTGGHVYMTGSYEGAPFGLSVVVPAKAGPFDLGTVVVRAKVEVDVHTAQLTVTTDPLPQIVGGVPVNLRLVNVTIDRPQFTYNPTSCDPSEVSGTMAGGQGATAALSNGFQVTNCGALKFQPRFKVSTTGKTSRKNGAGLTAKLTYPKTAQGVEANIAKVKVSLPKQLPSRLSTLQKACTAATFAANPANCPAASRVGIAKAVTPVLPVSLTGPAYFVSHGGEAFPDLVVVLQGYGVTIDLVGTTFISKSGITSTTFKQVPDVPVGSFEITLPQGPASALAANGNLCTAKLKMPAIFIGQDGAEIKTNTPMSVTGCPKHKSKPKHKHKTKHHKKKK